MAKKLEGISLFDIAPDSITGNADVQAIMRAVDPELQRAARNILKALIYFRIDELPEPVIDALAWQWHVDFYEPDLTLEVKRDLVMASIPWHRIKGTPAAVEQMATTVFGHSWITEWFEAEPKRRPYTFRLAVDLDDRTPDMNAAALANLRRIVSCAKNTRSFLELTELLFHMDDSVDVKDELAGLRLPLGYEDDYPYPPVPGEHNGRFIHGGVLRHDGRFAHDGTMSRSGVIPGWFVRRGALLRIDDLHLALHTSFYDDISAWSLTPERGGHDVQFQHNGILARSGAMSGNEEYTRNIFTLPLDWSLDVKTQIKAEDHADVKDNNGVMNISCAIRRNGSGRRDARAVRGKVRYSDILDGTLSIPRPARRGLYVRGGGVERKHDALPIAV